MPQVFTLSLNNGFFLSPSKTFWVEGMNACWHVYP